MDEPEGLPANLEVEGGVQGGQPAPMGLGYLVSLGLHFLQGVADDSVRGKGRPALHHGAQGCGVERAAACPGGEPLIMVASYSPGAGLNEEVDAGAGVGPAVADVDDDEDRDARGELLE